MLSYCTLPVKSFQTPHSTAEHTCADQSTMAVKHCSGRLFQHFRRGLHECFAFSGCFVFTFCRVHPKQAPGGLSLETVLVFHHVKPQSSSFLLMFWIIILLEDEPLTNQSVFPSSHVTSHFLTILTAICSTTSCTTVLSR